ncbi:MAG: hypothetical protein R2741_03225 [Methanolobus sp.]
MAEKIDLEGVVVYAPKADNGNGKVFIPQDAVDLLEASKPGNGNVDDEEYVDIDDAFAGKWELDTT